MTVNTVHWKLSADQSEVEGCLRRVCVCLALYMILCTLWLWSGLSKGPLAACQRTLCDFRIMIWCDDMTFPLGEKSSAAVQIGPGAHPASCTVDTGSRSRRSSGRVVALSTHPHLAPRLKNEWSYTSTPPLGLLWPVPGRVLPLLMT